MSVKIIQVTDVHFLPGEERRHGISPVDRFDAFVDQVNAEHGDAALVVVTGDIADYGDIASYEQFKTSVDRLHPPVQLMIGNHDSRENFTTVFAETPCDQNGFIQSYHDIDGFRLIFTDTVETGSHAGSYDPLRLDWLAGVLDSAPTGKTFLFTHHNPMHVHWEPLDSLAINDRDASALARLFKDNSDKIRHLFYGHGHRVIAGNWHGVSYSTMRGTMIGTDFRFDGNPVCYDKLEQPQYGVIFLDDDSVTHHIHDYLDESPVIGRDAY